MSATPSNPNDRTKPPDFDSLVITVISDEPGDTTVRPAGPLLRELGLKERERIARWLESQGNAPASAEPPAEAG